MHWRIWHGNKMHTFKVNLLLLAQNLFFSFIHFCSKLPMSIRMHVWCWYLSNVNNLLFLTLCISTWQANFFTLMYFFFTYLNYYLSGAVCASVCLSVFLQKKFFVQNGSNSQIRWTDISNSRIQARRAWRLVKDNSHLWCSK